MKEIKGRVYIKQTVRGKEVLEPAEGVVVSTDSTVGVTDASGAYTLPFRDGDRFVKMTTPRGARAESAWFYDLESGQEGSESDPLDFNLVPDAARDADEFAFIQVTDLHVDSRNGRVTPHILQDNLARLMTHWQDKVGFVAATGDLTTHAEVEELIGAREVLSDQPLPIFPLPGNHDLRGEGGTKRYLDYFGPDSYSFDWGPVHFIAYNAVDDEPPTFNSWLFQDLSLVPEDRPVVLMVHFPLGDSFYGTLRPYPIVASLSGHWHASRLYDDGRTVHYNTPPLNFGGGDYTPGCYRVFTWKDGELTAKTYALPPKSLDTGLAPEQDPRLGYTFRGMDGEPVGRAPSPGGTLTPLEWPHHMGGTERINRLNGMDSEGGGQQPTDLQPTDLQPTEPRLSDPRRTVLKEAWRFRVPGGLNVAAPVVSSGRMFIGTLDEDRPNGGRVVCLDAATGEHLWTTPVGESVKNTLATDGERVYGVTVIGEVFALDVQSGAPIWRMSLYIPSLRWIYSSPLVADGKVTVGMSGHFACFDAKTGAMIWERRDLSISDWISSFSSPTKAGGLVIVGFNGQDVGLQAFDVETGEIRWQNGDRTDSAITTPAVCGDVFYVVRRGGMLEKLTVEKGEVLWSREVAARTPATPLPDGDRLYLAAGDGRLLALSTEDGSALWERQIGSQSDDLSFIGRPGAVSIATPLLLGETLWLPGGDGVLYAFHASDGAELAQHNIGTPLLSAPVPAQDGLYVTDASGCVHALSYD